MILIAHPVYIYKVFDILYMWLVAIWLQLNTVIACIWAKCVTAWNAYETNMTLLRWGITLE